MEHKLSIKIFVYFLAILSFIPIIGIIFIIGSVSYGIAKRKNGGYKILIIGVLGFITQILLANYTFNKVFSDDKSILVKLTIENTYKDLNKTIKNIELYKKYKKKYPIDLEELTKFNKTLDKKSTHLNDHFTVLTIFNDKKIAKPTLLNYKLINNSKYYLYSSGIDLKQNTKDDIYPRNIKIKSGYIDKRK